MVNPHPSTPHTPQAPAPESPPSPSPSCGDGCCGQAIRLRPAAPSATREHGHGAGDRHDHGHHHGQGHAQGQAHGGANGGAQASKAGDGHDHGPLPSHARLAAALALALGAELLHLLRPDTGAWHLAGLAMAALAIALAGTGIYRSGLRSLLRGRLGIDTLMAVAVTGAFLIGQWPEAAMVMALYALAERIEHAAADRARHAIAGLMALAPDEAELRGPDGQWQRVAAARVAVGAVIRVRPGARLPLDGTVIAGRSSIDQASVTGESIPVDKAPGDPVFAATVNQGGELQVQVTAATGQTTLDRIVQAVEQAQAARAPTQRFVERFAAVYTPTVFALAVALAVLPPLLLGWPWTQAIYKALVLLVIACPCALVISTPVTLVSGLTAAARRGILIKGGTHLEQARALRAVALDKTGTLTTGAPTLVHWRALGDAPSAAVMRQARQLAGRSDHPVSRAIAVGLAAESADAGDADPLTVDNFRAWPGRGVEARVDGQTLLLGNRRLIEERGLGSPELAATLAEHEQAGHSVTLLADARAVRGLFAVADRLRPSARAAVAALKALGVTPVILSGDHPGTVQAVAREAGIDDACGGLLPEDKQQAVRALRERHGRVGMVGDGINDAPALAQAQLGFAMGAAGTDIAMESADVVIMNDDLGRIAETIRLSRRTHALLWQNIALALGIKALFFGLAVLGNATLWMAVFADLGASLLVIGNGLRMLSPARAPGDAAPEPAPATAPIAPTAG